MTCTTSAKVWSFTGVHLHYNCSIRASQVVALFSSIAQLQMAGVVAGDICSAKLIEHVLDRFLANEEWFQIFPNCKATHLNVLGSDHHPILLETISALRPIKTFKFDKRWIQEAEFSQLVVSSWRTPVSGTKQYIIMTKLKRLRNNIMQWKKHSQSNSQGAINSLKQQLISASNRPSTHQFHEIRTLECRLAEEIKKEESFWKQKARQKWLLEGDREQHSFLPCECSREKTFQLHPSNPRLGWPLARGASSGG
ncbi:hypothetical protein Cni_G19512 [Canna indica]|uniref:Endonuclease/exonuclease/phosphatase n=1 Tax=Canna indica TaxID=4628 RepID=A0AAQ3QIP6_9LILI|nr:hypothetical protein Cni_G19512 [Canna indica]